jgi:hypothetical protein
MNNSIKMENIDMKAMCEQQSFLSKLYMEQQKQRGKEARAKYPPYKCCLCKRQKYGFGNNPAPCSDNGRCCDECNVNIVIPARVDLMVERKFLEKLN